jgi:hypothetical protein
VAAADPLDKTRYVVTRAISLFRGADAGEATYRFTAAFDEKADKFRIISKKKVPSKE